MLVLQKVSFLRFPDFWMLVFHLFLKSVADYNSEYLDLLANGGGGRDNTKFSSVAAVHVCRRQLHA